MRRLLRCAPFLLAFAASLHAEPVTSIPTGRWDGILRYAENAMPISLRVLADGSGLLDLPANDLFGYPIPAIAAEGGGLGFALGSGEGALRIEGALAPSTESPPRIEGVFSFNAISGTLSFALSSPEPAEGEARGIPVRGGTIAGSLLLPEGPGPFPLVIIVSGAGTTDRDGNNYNVPGRNDGLKALALALREAKVASFRFDKRGTGESHGLVPREEDLVFGDYVEDCAAVIVDLARDERFHRMILVGHTEGALVAAAAAAKATAGTEGMRIAGLALLCPTAKGAAQTIDEALVDIPEEFKAEAASIMGALRRGERWPEPSEYFSDFFRPSFQPYLASWFGYDLNAELGAFEGPLLLVQGNRDVQVSLVDFLPIATMRPDAAAVVLPGMNHVLKEVSSDLDENLRAFSDPGFPLAEGLAGLLAAFAEGSSLPEGLARVDGGVLPAAPPEESQDEAQLPVEAAPAQIGTGETASPATVPTETLPTESPTP